MLSLKLNLLFKITRKESVYNFYVTNNSFNAPLPYDDTSYYPIYLVTDDYMTSLGLTTTKVTTGKSKIYIRYSQVAGSTSDCKITLSHEFNHAVMGAYLCTGSSAENWFKESFASLMALVYNGSATTWYRDAARGYLEKSYYSINSDVNTSFLYGTFMFPLYIYTYLGGIQTIRSIYEEYSDAGNPYDAITNSRYISSYRTAFLESVTRNYKPTDFYSYATSAWGTGSINEFTVPYTGSPSAAVNPMACHYQRFSSSTNIGTAYFTIQITSNDGSGMMLNKITEESSGNLIISTVSTSFTRITIQQTNFGAIIQKLTLIPVNTNSNGYAITYQLTAST